MRTVWKPIPLLVLTVLLIGGLAACQILVNPVAPPQEQAMAGNATIDATLPGEAGGRPVKVAAIEKFVK